MLIRSVSCIHVIKNLLDELKSDALHHLQAGSWELREKSQGLIELSSF